MSLYDWVLLNHPLFAEDLGEIATCYDLLAPFYEEYEITSEGRLLHTEVNYEDQSDPNATGLMALRGAMTPVPTGNKIDMAWNGALDLSTSRHEWHCHFADGLLVGVWDFNAKSVKAAQPKEKP